VIKKILLTLGLGLASSGAKAELIELDFGSWEIMYSCEHRGVESFHYKTVEDTGELKRYKPFHQEMRIPKRCRQFKTSSYRLPKNAKISYDRGHNVHQNVWDHSSKLMKQSNSMANIVPQASKLNRRGVWRYTEEVTECFRDFGTVEVWGGSIWGNDSTNDHFIKSHGVTTPDHLWKIIRLPNGKVNAWLMPNDNSPTRSRMDNYLVAPATIAKLTGIQFDIPSSEMSQMDTHSFQKPKYCSLK
jgi:endonuclease G